MGFPRRSDVGFVNISDILNIAMRRIIGVQLHRGNIIEINKHEAFRHEIGLNEFHI